MEEWPGTHFASEPHSKGYHPLWRWTSAIGGLRGCGQVVSHLSGPRLQGSEEEVHSPFFRCLGDPHCSLALHPLEASGAPHIHPAYGNVKEWTRFPHFPSPPLLPQWPIVQEREEDFLSSHHSSRSELRQLPEPCGGPSRVQSSSEGQQLLKADERERGAQISYSSQKASDRVPPSLCQPRASVMQDSNSSPEAPG